MNMYQQLIKDRQEAANAAGLAIKTLIEKHDELDGGERYHWITQYGNKMVEVQRLEQILGLMGGKVPPVHHPY